MKNKQTFSSIHIRIRIASREFYDGWLVSNNDLHFLNKMRESPPVFRDR